MKDFISFHPTKIANNVVHVHQASRILKARIDCNGQCCMNSFSTLMYSFAFDCCFVTT
jgi:hypothetical protein